MNRFTILIALISIQALFAGCALVSPSSAGSAETQSALAAQGTLAALQGTVDAMQAGARKTAQAWMTESPAGQPGTRGTEEVPTDSPPAGSISGKLSFPGEEIPPLRVVAFNVDSNEYFTTELTDSGVYTIDMLPAGRYQVVAYLLDPGPSQATAGGYTQAVPCGLSVRCGDHSLITIAVKEGEVVENIDPGDWYAPAGSLPPDPTRK